ncbi:MAG: transposase family protein, partial [Nitrososphaeraceae archaeon]
TVKSVLPFRKSRKKSELSNEEKKYNRKHSKLRVIVEHTVSRIKKFGRMGTKFRNKLGRYDYASDLVSGLVNFRIMMRTNRMLL